MTVCSVDACATHATRRGMCNLHYRRTRRHGDPSKTINRPLGSGTPHNGGYWMFEIDGRSVLRHVLIAERALGKRLPVGAEVHHVDSNRSNDAPSNLVICPDKAYHKLLHSRTAALEACGNANWRKCNVCKQYDDPSRLRTYKPSGMVHHADCFNAYERTRRQTHVHHV